MIDETRKAIKWGKSKTLVVSLPRRWTKKFSVEPDSQLQIKEALDGSLRIAPLHMVGPPILSEATIRLLDQDELALTTLLENYFVAGYDQLILKSHRRFNDRVRNLILSFFLLQDRSSITPFPVTTIIQSWVANVWHHERASAATLELARGVTLSSSGGCHS